ncbi:BspA family leucine-rich repeat surface protein [Xylocopilactobacillus apicola]|uniref:WxL domain-containing protein n=1 Tax=Xylocopilactobacillus apicola TaxID=2932184 RepID=A0AAU9DPV6_9LACO|nr:BspA family leucine-rich repeat surface protein [Xylocopilactobacillus apicola]BDR57859.1 hypothetical protein XA3_03000 [Xylocopilactobacillus apicola]
MILILLGLVLKSESVNATQGPLPTFPNVSTDLTTLISDKYKFNPIKFINLYDTQYMEINPTVSDTINCAIKPYTYDLSANIDNGTSNPSDPTYPGNPMNPMGPSYYMMERDQNSHESIPELGNTGGMKAVFTYDVSFDDGAGHLSHENVTAEVVAPDMTDWIVVGPYGSVYCHTSTAYSAGAMVKLTFRGIPKTGHLTFGGLVMGHSANIHWIESNPLGFTKIYTRSDTVLQNDDSMANSDLNLSVPIGAYVGNPQQSQLTGIYEIPGDVLEVNLWVSDDLGGNNGQRLLHGFMPNSLVKFGKQQGSDFEKVGNYETAINQNPLSPLLVPLDSPQPFANPVIQPLGSLQPFGNSVIEPRKVRSLYTIKNKVATPSSSSDYLSKYQIDDDLSSAWKVDASTISITDEQGTDATGKFSVTVDSNNHLLIAAKAASLSSASFYGHTYTYEINGPLNPETADTWQNDLQQTNGYQFSLGYPNIAKLTKQVGTNPPEISESEKVNNRVFVFKPSLHIPQRTFSRLDLPYNGGAATFYAETLTDPDYLDIYLTYRDTNGVMKTQPWNLQNPTTMVQNRLKLTDSGILFNWSAKFPADFDGSINQTAIVTLKDQEGVKVTDYLYYNLWWQIEGDALAIYPHELNAEVDAPNGQWPWEDQYRKIKSIKIKPGVTAKKSLSHLFSGLLYAESIQGLENLDTSNVENFNTMFSLGLRMETLDLSSLNTTKATSMVGFMNLCGAKNVIFGPNFDTTNVTDFRRFFANVGLNEIDLSKFKISNSASTTGMLSDNKQIWKLTLGPNSKLSADAGLHSPTEGELFTDQADPTVKWYPTSTNWREVKESEGGSAHKPKGDLITAAQILADSKTRTDRRTYVFDQTGKQSLTITGNPDFGTYTRGQKESSQMELQMTNNKNGKNGKNWEISAAMTKPFHLTDDPTKVVTGDPLSINVINRNKVTKLSSAVQKVYDGTSTDLYRDEETIPFTLIFETDPANFPARGIYTSELTFTIVNETP